MKQILEWQRDDYRALNTELLSFRDKLAQLKLTTNYRSRTVSSSNEQFVTATVSSGAAQASYSITEVKNLAKAATMVNGGGITGKDGKFDPTKSLKDQLPDGFKWEQGVVESQTLTVDKDGNVPEFKFDGDLKEVNVIVNGRAVKITTDETNHKADEVLVKSDGTLVFGENVKPANGSVVKINYVVNEKTTSKTVGEDPIKTWSLGKGALNTGSVKIEYNGQTYSVTEGNKLKSGDDVLGEINLDTGVITFAEEKEIKDTEITATFTQDYASFGINTHTSKGEVNETIFMTGTDTLNSVIRKVNESSAGVTMFYDSFTDQVTLTRKETGKFGDGEKDIQVNGDFMTNILNFDNQIVDDGQNAKFTINGLETERSSNTFDMSGVTITLKQTFGADSNQQAGRRFKSAGCNDFCWK